MGNTECSSQSRNNEEEEERRTSSSALKIGAAVARSALFLLGALLAAAGSTMLLLGAGLLALGAYTLSSLSDSHSSDPGLCAVAGSALFLLGAGAGLLKLGDYTLASLSSSHSGDHGLRAGDSNKIFASQPIKIMTYNVWIHEDVKVCERMEAIGQLIEKHSPDIILFQEVTPNIYRIFQASNWRKIYGYCSPIKAKTSSFCMLVSKLQVEKFFCEPFENSRPEKELCYAEITTGENMKLLAATSHFKYPDPRERTCEERMAQAKQALRVLDRWPNVIFGGDFNWVEKSDGPLPLLSGWQDAWPSLRPGEDGWTHDARSNDMSRGKLQKRPDRFLCKLQDFEMVDVKIIGTDPIPGISHYNNKGEERRVFPSDHYGLVLTIRRI